ncbi:hypothetical protein [Oceanobacillus kapialis]|uniref:hypothetical protein n=1 Tax=Oceanobacillus kapialis TaxID=481353 RepID=UPI00384BDDAE
MPTIQEVEMKLNETAIDDTMRSSIKKEIAVLPTVLEQDEKIMLVISGSYRYKNGMFVATSTSLLFL